MVKKLLMLVGDYVEDYEVMIPFQMLETLGHTIDCVSPGKQAGEQIITSIHDFEGEQTYSEKKGHFFTLNATFDDIKPEDYDALLIPGGRSPEFLRMNERVIEITKHFAEAKKVIGAICHGQLVLTAAGIMNGVQCTAYPAVRPELEMCGASWVDPGEGFDVVHTHQNIITAPAWPANADWTKAILDALGESPVCAS